jgi:hypothetical protein
MSTDVSEVRAASIISNFTLQGTNITKIVLFSIKENSEA